MNLLFILADVIQQCWSFVLVYFDKPQLLLTQRQNNFWHYIEKWRESRVSFIKDTAWHYRNWSVKCNSTKDPVFTVCTFLRVLLQSSCSSPITGTKYQWAAEASLPKEFHANLLKMRTITISGLLGNFLKLPANSSQAPLWFRSKGHHLYLPAIPVAVSMYWVLHRKQSTYECQQCWDAVKLCFTLRGWLFSEIFWTSNECKSLLNKNSAGSLLLSFYWVSKKCQDLNKPLNYFYRQYAHSWNTSYPNSK